MAFGKKVIFLNNFYPSSNFCRQIFPREFHFAIPTNNKKLYELSEKCLNNDLEINISYQKLRKKLNGEINFSKKYNSRYNRKIPCLDFNEFLFPNTSKYMDQELSENIFRLSYFFKYSQ